MWNTQTLFLTKLNHHSLFFSAADILHTPLHFVLFFILCELIFLQKFEEAQFCTFLQTVGYHKVLSCFIYGTHMSSLKSQPSFKIFLFFNKTASNDFILNLSSANLSKPTSSKTIWCKMDSNWLVSFTVRMCQLHFHLQFHLFPFWSLHLYLP